MVLGKEKEIRKKTKCGDVMRQKSGMALVGACDTDKKDTYYSPRQHKKGLDFCRNNGSTI